MKQRLIFFSLLLSIVLGSCENDCFTCEDCITASGNIQSEERTLSTFSGIDMQTPCNIYLSQGENQSITISCSNNYLQYIETEVIDETLTIYSEQDFCSSTPCEVYITITKLKQLAIIGTGDIVAKTQLTSNNLQLIISGVGDISIDTLNVGELTTEISGTGNVTLAGIETANHHTATLGGVGNINSFDLPVSDITLVSSGVGNCKVYAVSTLDVTISGVGNVYYIGEPTIMQQISGYGKLIESN